MTIEDWQKKVLQDINDRGLFIGGFIVGDGDGHLRYLRYDQNGFVEDISHPRNTITIYGKDDAGTRVMNEITKISGIKQETDNVTKLELVDD